MIVGNANCAKEEFVKSFGSLAHRLFPRYEFRNHPANHVLFTKQQFQADRWKSPPVVLGLSNGVRELVLLLPTDDPAKAWQTRSDRTREELFQLGGNIVSYAMDKARRVYKGQGAVIADAGVKPQRTARVVRLAAGPNADPEPGGWRRVRNLVKNTAKLDLKVESAPASVEKLRGAALVHLTGTTKFALKPTERAALKAFVEAGGTLVVDAAGGNADFADAAEDELRAIFGETAKAQLEQPLDAKHVVYQMPDAAVARFAYRRFARELLVGKLNIPRVRGLTIGKGDRVGVFFSREDLTAGMVGQPVDGVIGYEPATATAIMRNIAVYAANGGRAAPPATQPTKKPAPKPAVAGPVDPLAPPPAPAKPGTNPPAAPAPAEPLPF